MRRSILLAAALLTGAAAPSYTISKTVPLGAPDKWDYVTFDAASHRVFVAHSDHTDVIDAATGAVLGKLAEVNGAHGQAVAADGAIWAVNGKTANVTAHDPKTFKAVTTLPAQLDADGAIVDPSGKTLVVLNGDGESATLIDTVSRTVHANIKLGGAPEFAAADTAGHLYINIASTREIAAVDMQAGRVTGRYAVPDCLSPHGLAMDPKSRRLFTSCENTKLQVVDADTGQVLQSLPIGHGTDAAGFDPMRNLVYSSNSDGTLSVFHEDGGKLTALGNVQTPPGARTMAVDPSNGRVFLVTADLAATQPAPEGGRIHYSYKPGTVKLLFLDPTAK